MVVGHHSVVVRRTQQIPPQVLDGFGQTFPDDDGALTGGFETGPGVAQVNIRQAAERKHAQSDHKRCGRDPSGQPQ